MSVVWGWIKKLEKQFHLRSRSVLTANIHEQSLSTSLCKTINTDEAIALFHSIIQRNSEKRLLLLEGPTHMGKSHLLLKVFPTIASEQQVRYVSIELTRKPITIVGILESACEELGRERCSSYQRATDERRRSPNVNVALKDMKVKQSEINIDARTKSADRDQLWYSHLTAMLVEDIKRMRRDNRRIVFFVDNIDGVDDSIQGWLIDILLKQLASLAHVRIVIAAQKMPTVHSTYADSCLSHQLMAITDIGAYTAFCRDSGVTLVEQAVQAIAFLSDYCPGFFVYNIDRMRRAKLL